MRADMAAAYVDEPSVEAFKAKVARGVYPAPVRAKGCLRSGTGKLWTGMLPCDTAFDLRCHARAGT